MRISDIKKCMDINLLIELHNNTYNEINAIKSSNNFNYKCYRNKKQLFKIINNNIAVILYSYDNVQLASIAKQFNPVIIRYFKSYYNVNFSYDTLSSSMINGGLYSFEYSGYTRNKVKCKIKQPNCKAGYTREYMNYLNGLTFVNGELIQSSSIMAYNKKMIIAYNNRQSKNYDISNNARIVYSSIKILKSSELVKSSDYNSTVKIEENYKLF